MNQSTQASHLTVRFAPLHATEKALISILALMGPSASRSRLMEYLASANLKSPKGTGYNISSIDAVLSELVRLGLIEHTSAGAYQCAPALIEAAINSAISNAQFDRLCAAVESVERISVYGNQIYFPNYTKCIHALRLALIRGGDRGSVSKYLMACSAYPDFRQMHPYVEIFGRPFNARFLALLHPEMQEVVLAALLQDAMLRLQEAKTVAAYAQNLFKSKSPGTHSAPFTAMYAEHALLTGQFDLCQDVLVNRLDGANVALHSAIALLRGNLDLAIGGFEAALKAFRANSAVRTSVFTGLSAFYTCCKHRSWFYISYKSCRVSESIFWCH